jgi:hypothetical protein
MEPGLHTPLLDLFRRGEVDRDIRLMAAEGAIGLHPDEQSRLLELLSADPDPEIATAAQGTLAASIDRPVEPEPEPAEDATTREASAMEKLARMNPAQRMARAMRGTREERAILIRDPNKIVAVAVLSSPRMSDSEVEAIAKMTNVSDDVLRIIGNSRAWTKNYSVVFALVKNPKTPLAVSMNLLPRLNEKDVKLLSTDRNISDVLRLTARKKLTVR